MIEFQVNQEIPQLNHSMDVDVELTNCWIVGLLTVRSSRNLNNSKNQTMSIWHYLIIEWSNHLITQFQVYQDILQCKKKHELDIELLN